MQRYKVGEAARLLGVGTDAIRKRIKRGTIPTEFEAGTRYVLLDESETRHAPGADTGADSGRALESDALISELRAHNATLREQLAAERQAHAEARRIIAGLVERIPAIEAASEARESPQTAEEEPQRAEPHPATGEAQEGAQRRPWWRRWLGR